MLLGICLVGRPAQGKTRLAWEAIQGELPTWRLVKWPHEREYEFDFAAQRGKHIVLWLDDLHEYANLKEATTLSDLPRRFDEAQAHLIIVATCRDGEYKKQAQQHLSTLLERLTEIHLPDISLEEVNQLAETLTRDGVQVSGKFDGTPGSLLLGVQRMRDSFLHLPFSAQSILKTMKLLRSINIFTYPESRLCSVARDLFSFNEQDWREACDTLDQEHFVRKRVAVHGEQLLEPIADVYLEEAVEGYPTPSADISDDWPQLQNTLLQIGDASALISLGIAFEDRLLGNLRSNKSHAEDCFRTVLRVSTRESSPVLWAIVQLNLGNVLSDQAELAEGQKQLELLSQAEQAHRAALEVSTLENSPSDWADTQFNLAFLNFLRVSFQHDNPEEDIVVSCAWLREAEQYIEHALSFFTPEANPTRNLQATKFQEMIKEALQEYHDFPETEE